MHVRLIYFNMMFLLCVVLFLFTFLPLLYLLIFFCLMDEPSLKIFYRTFIRDNKGLFLYMKIYIFMQYCAFRNLNVLYFFNRLVKKYPNEVLLIFEDEQWTFKQIDEHSNRIAHFFLQEGYRKGDEVALLMENCPDYVCCWLGLAKIGVVTALINTNLKSESLAHSANSIIMKGLIFGQNFAETLENAMPYIQKADTAKFYSYSRKPDMKPVLSFACTDLNDQLKNVSRIPLDPEMFKIGTGDKLMYIYTSGTTGLPKAAIITHRRYLYCGRCTYCILSSYDPRIIYNPLPLYHVAGTVFYMSTVLIFGGKMIIRKKFSATNFWKDVVKHKATICVYIGEMCRYLLNQRKVPEETQHNLQCLLGNGIKPHVWKELQDRFRIKDIKEVYGATEGNIVLANLYGKVGAVGIISRINQKIQGVYLIKVHPETGEVMRRPNGFCISCKPGEPGELVGAVSNANPVRQYDGYLSKVESNRKVVRDCFKKGDSFFASGDIFVMDEDGYLFFKDRFGDTFRWKGENVSTTEVENVISKALNYASCIVYGVEIPDNEGRVGMAAVQVDDYNNINFENFYDDITERLPSYAIPAFLRISNAIDETGTYKLKKVHFQEQGYNLEIVDDPLFVLDVKNKTFIPLTSEIYNDVIKGIVKF